MANPQDPNVPVPTPDGQPSFSQRLFSEEVGIAAADSGLSAMTPEPGYEWSNGRKFASGNGATGG